MGYIAWLAFAVAAGAMFDASMTRNWLENRVNEIEIEIEIELLKYDQKHGKL